MKLYVNYNPRSVLLQQMLDCRNIKYELVEEFTEVYNGYKLPMLEINGKYLDFDDTFKKIHKGVIK